MRKILLYCKEDGAGRTDVLEKKFSILLLEIKIRMKRNSADSFLELEQSG